MPAVDPVGPTMEEPLAARPTSLRGEAHDEGDLADMSGYEEAWTTVETSAYPIGVGMETAGDAPSSAAQDPPMVTEQATAAVVTVMGMGLGRLVRAQQRLRLSPPRAVATEVEEIVREPAQPPQVLQTC